MIGRFFILILVLTVIALACWGACCLAESFIKDKIASQFVKQEHSMLEILMHTIDINKRVTKRHHTIFHAVIRSLKQFPPCRLGIIKEVESAATLNAGLTLPCWACPLYDKEDRLCKGWSGKIIIKGREKS